MTTDILLPCPFCGGQPLIEKTLRSGYENCADDIDAYAYAMRCQSCATLGGWSKSESGAVRCWNMRPGDKYLNLDAMIERNRERKRLRDLATAAPWGIWKGHASVFSGSAIKNESHKLKHTGHRLFEIDPDSYEDNFGSDDEGVEPTYGQKSARWAGKPFLD
ncbi:MAG: Lar family restriction alleviation protein [Stenomitos frigidus ULC029]